MSLYLGTTQISGVATGDAAVNIQRARVALQWTPKFTKMQTPTLSTISKAITIKAMTYYDGYWYGVGNDASGDAYKIYGATTGNLTATIASSGRNYPANGIACDGTYIWISLGSGAYSDRVLIRQDIATFRSSSTTFNVYTSTAIHHTDICRINDAHTFIFGSKPDGSGGGISKITNGSTSVNFGYFYSTYCPEPIVSGCSYNGTAVAISASGHILQWQDTSGTNVRYSQFSGNANHQMCRQMNQYFCVAYTTDNGTFIKFREGTVFDEYQSFKITDEILTVVGMAYAGGLYVLVGVNASGETKVWQATDIQNYGIYGYDTKVALSSGYITRAMATDGTNICLLADNGSAVQEALVAID